MADRVNPKRAGSYPARSVTDIPTSQDLGNQLDTIHIEQTSALIERRPFFASPEFQYWLANCTCR